MTQPWVSSQGHPFLHNLYEWYYNLQSSHTVENQNWSATCQLYISYRSPFHRFQSLLAWSSYIPLLALSTHTTPAASLGNDQWSSCVPPPSCHPPFALIACPRSRPHATCLDCLPPALMPPALIALLPSKAPTLMPPA